MSNQDSELLAKDLYIRRLERENASLREAVEEYKRLLHGPNEDPQADQVQDVS